MALDFSKIPNAPEQDASKPQLFYDEDCEEYAFPVTTDAENEKANPFRYIVVRLGNWVPESWRYDIRRRTSQ